MNLWHALNRRAKLLGYTLFLASIACLSACASKPDNFGGSQTAVAVWAQSRNFVTVDLSATPFSILALTRGQGKQWTIYLEGDGAPWPTPFYPPADPTPKQPTALALAAADHSSAVLYLGRPCQYLDPEALKHCSVDYWTERRFSPEVINSYQQQLDVLKIRFGIQKFHLIGHSGGGVIATLLAARRNDVEQLITVASPLSLAAWTKQHGLTLLRGSLDPGEDTQALPPAWHFVGGNDSVVPAAVVNDFITKRGGRLLPVAEFDHVCCWSRDWPALLEKTR